MSAIFSWFSEVGFSGLLDMAVMTFLIYSLLVWFKKTKAAFVLTGILIIAGIYLITRQFNLVLTAAVFERFFAVILIALVVIFQEELRNFFEQVAVFSLKRRSLKPQKFEAFGEQTELLVRTMMDLAGEHIGALVVLKGKDMIVRHMEGGVEVNGSVSEPLLKSIFDPHSIGHDGAVILEGNMMKKFSCHLPLSKETEKVGRSGTRHAAALGLAEKTDALCLVVSEERGTVSVARNGRLYQGLNAGKLKEILLDFYREIHPGGEKRFAHDFLKKNSREKVIAAAMAVALWFVLVHGAKWVYKTYAVPVRYPAIPEGLVLKSIQPKEVDITFSAQRRAFYFFSGKKINLDISFDMRPGEVRVRVLNSHVAAPKNLNLETIDPREVIVRLEKAD